jgi:NADPH2:quinone reductase
MTRAIIIREHGGPDVLKVEDLEVGLPGPGQIKVRHRAVGLNFIDVYQRTGLYKVPLPFVAGNEAAGEVMAVGAGVADFEAGDRIAYQGPVGAYADERLMPADKAVKLPDGIDFDTAAAALLKGNTAFYLLHWTHAVKPGDVLLIHAAAGGTGQILTQWAVALGATVIGTAGSEDKCETIRRNGAALAVNYKTGDFVAEVKAFTEGRGVDVVYDGVGAATFEPSLDCLRPRGLMVSFGNASGPVSLPRLGILAEKGSLYVTRPTSGAYFPDAESLRTGAASLFDAISSGKVKIEIGGRFPLIDAAEAHRALEARATSGSTLLIP